MIFKEEIFGGREKVMRSGYSEEVEQRSDC